MTEFTVKEITLGRATPFFGKKRSTKQVSMIQISTLKINTFCRSDVAVGKNIRRQLK